MKKLVRVLLIFISPTLLLFIGIILCTTLEISVLIESNSSSDESDESVASGERNLLLSAEVENYRNDVMNEAKKNSTEEYVDLFLAVMMQESGGRGNDIFQASESINLPPNTLNVNDSIKYGVLYLSQSLVAAKVKSPKDIPRIKLALQNYNFGAGYTAWALAKDGGWTQDNTFEFAKIHSHGVKNVGERKDQLGPWRYGDQYYTQHVLRYYDMDKTNVSAGAAAAISLDDRLSWLFPDGTPTTEKQMQPYLTQIQVNILNQKGKPDTMNLTVHKKLAAEIKAVFEDLKNEKFKVLPEATAGYSWRKMASGTGSLSHHSYGCVVDLNWTHNGASYTSWPFNPDKDEYAVNEKIVKIWKKHGFYWGGDWKGKYKDPMHFTYTNH